MEICGHLIKTETIIGVGPLMQKEHPDDTMRQAYRPVLPYFEVHTTSGSIKIEYDWLQVGNSRRALRPDEEKARKRFEEFADGYYASRKKIAALIGEPEAEQNRYDKV